ncbi:hypothetical protein RBH26_21240 [Natronolimnohabitans sp. A-GB9]|uniref:DUF6610 family protein n=1 Tax=Natronolimnohabitans sp. A-GB9 TaxID=3069757 RepID=UPI0027B7E22E|nr:DUF6610 family protein [Natronolimnohabitans sp. A-GB9]MDQ2052971.1 hypothetical protein [Natronolimnohabitans sp. A-GB9]
MSQVQQTLFSDSYNDPHRPLLKRLRKVDVITTVNGGTDTAYAAARSGVMVGIRSNYRRPPRDVQIDFVDWPFTEIDGPDDVEATFEHHLEVVKRERPKYAVAPDIDENVGYNEAVRYAVLLEEFCETVIMVPKSIHPLDVPDRFRVGMPCQERFGGTPHPWSEYRDCREVHVLGGHPTKQFQAEKYYVPVHSVDTAVPISRARWGDVWSFSDRKFLRQNRGYYGSIQRSFGNIWTEWNGVDVTLGRRERMRYRKPVSAYDPAPFPDETLLAPGDDVPFPGRVWHMEN